MAPSKQRGASAPRYPDGPQHPDHPRRRRLPRPHGFRRPLARSARSACLAGLRVIEAPRRSRCSRPSTGDGHMDRAGRRRCTYGRLRYALRRRPTVRAHDRRDAGVALACRMVELRRFATVLRSHQRRIRNYKLPRSTPSMARAVSGWTTPWHVPEWSRAAVVAVFLPRLPCASFNTFFVPSMSGHSGEEIAYMLEGAQKYQLGCGGSGSPFSFPPSAP